MMMVEIKKEVIQKFMKKHNLSKTEFCKLVHTSPKMFKRVMNNEKVSVFIGLRYATYMEIAHKILFDSNLC